jgi:hypothetical protein
MEKAGFHPDVVKQIVEHSRKLIESGEKDKIVTGIKLIEISGDFRQGDLVLAAWNKNSDNKDVEVVAEVALVNMLRVHELARLSRAHPEWDKKRLWDQALGHALSKTSGIGADPAKWRELWKTVLAEAGQGPEGKAPPEQPGAGQP